MQFCTWFFTRSYFIFYDYSLSSIFVVLLWTIILWICHKKKNITPVDAITYPINCVSSPLLSLYHLNFVQVDNAHWHHSTTNMVYLIGAALKGLAGANTINDGGG